MKFAFLFPGQGSQSVGMMQGFGDQPVIRDTFTEASDVLGQDLWRMVTEPNEELNQTANTQPLMLTAGVAVWRAWLEAGGARPSVMAGHSLGEYTALVAAGALEFSAALPLVRYRAEVMQGAVAEGVGAMAAILGLDDEAVRAVCTESAQGEVLEAVNFNSPGQVVIAGHKTAVERGMEAAKAKGAKRALILPVSVPSHCALMKPAADKLAVYLESVAVSAPQIPVLHNADVQAYSDAQSIKNALVRQLYSPVRWVETVQAISAQGIAHAAECGPGKVLAGLNKRIVADMTCFALTGIEAVSEAKNQLNA
ncbi:MAG: ACP S-malonyltransferase [Methylophilaceae bacterium]|uniref:ACP S-malonyltransferase n=1 Tax=Methylobacillus sp. MM3 TaxID=1848039 RepID=UPI0007E04978|nr:ACP S-malonyltransferase [Methylobacillus sp. MM3]OAJ71514.1 malonyl CoA-acyl carrier protein transacylase [Methylobacillus sp. MM3]